MNEITIKIDDWLLWFLFIMALLSFVSICLNIYKMYLERKIRKEVKRK
jgi:hypothetical protein